MALPIGLRGPIAKELGRPSCGGGKCGMKGGEHAIKCTDMGILAQCNGAYLPCSGGRNPYDMEWHDSHAV